MTDRILTCDEQKAAEAAFQGRPCNPKWSSSAQTIYEGLTKALTARASVEEREEALVAP
jgi:hypothetical protein